MMLPAPSTALADALWRAARGPHPDVGPRADQISDEARIEAADRLALLNEMVRPPTPGEVRVWLARLMPLARAPSKEADFNAALYLFVLALNDVPAALLNEATLRKVVQATEFWPQPAFVLRLIADQIDELRRERAALLAIIHAPPAALSATRSAAPMCAAERERIAKGLPWLVGQIMNGFREDRP